MSTSHRICETCVYCSFAGNCDRHDKPLTSIEQPACDAYEIHPLLAENAKLRELVRDMNKWLWNGADCTECPFAAKCDLNAAFESDLHAHICLGWSEIHDRMRELGVEP